MNKIEINEANGKLAELIEQLEKNVTDQHILLKDGKAIAVLRLYTDKDEEQAFPEIGGKDWDKLDDEMKKYWSDFGSEEI